MADDLGYAEPGSHGSDIRTPNLDALAADGIRFTQFHTAPMSAPTRAMLLNADDNHAAGMAARSPPEFVSRRVKGYEGRRGFGLWHAVRFHQFPGGVYITGAARDALPPERRS